MDTFIYIGAFFLLFGWAGLLIRSLADKYDDDHQKKSSRNKCLPNVHSYKASKTRNPWLR